MPDLSPAEFAQIRDLVRQICGVVLAEGKEYLVVHRIGPLVRESGAASYAEFLARVRAERQGPWYLRLIDAITTHETSFFRDGHPFEAITRAVLPWLWDEIRARKKRLPARRGPKARIWCAATSTGQEPYSLAMLVHEVIERDRPPGVAADDLAILATDISTQVLSTAMNGRYSGLMVGRGLSEERRRRFFVQTGTDTWEVAPALRSLVEFRALNLLQPFTHLGPSDVILCRNVLIYFEASVRRLIVEQLRDLLPAGGFLLLGAAESTDAPIRGLEPQREGLTTFYRRVADPTPA